MSEPLDLRDALELACIETLRGDPPGPGLARRLERACQTVLRRRGERGARVRAHSDHRGTRVEVLLRQPGQAVQRVVLSLG